MSKKGVRVRASQWAGRAGPSRNLHTTRATTVRWQGHRHSAETAQTAGATVLGKGHDIQGHQRLSSFPGNGACNMPGSSPVIASSQSRATCRCSAARAGVSWGTGRITRGLASYRLIRFDTPG